MRESVQLYTPYWASASIAAGAAVAGAGLRGLRAAAAGANSRGSRAAAAAVVGLGARPPEHTHIKL